MPVMLLIGYELHVCNESYPLFDRYYAGIKLIKHWVIARQDDVQGVYSDGVRQVTMAVDVKVSSSKTTGIGKKVETYSVTISAHA